MTSNVAVSNEEARRARRTELQRRRRALARNARATVAVEDQTAPSAIAAVAGDLEAERRARRAEQQRQRRAFARSARAAEDQQAQPGNDVTNLTRAVTEDQRPRETIQSSEAQGEEPASNRARRAEQQRRRRSVVSANGRDAYVQAETSQRSRRRQRESGDVREARRTRRRRTDQARNVARSAGDVATLESLAERILSLATLRHEEIEWMSKGQRFVQDPRLALAYYYCCGMDPGSFVFGNERLCGASADVTRQRLEELLNDYPKAEDVAACQQATANSSPENTDLWACASCGRVLMVNGGDIVRFRRLSHMEKWVASDSEKAALTERASMEFVRRYRQMYFDREQVYFLIPELVRDHTKIPLCVKCDLNPRTSKFSVASGHDYGRVGQLPVLSEIVHSCITPIRCFGLDLTLSGSTGHAIAFPSSGPCEFARELPSVECDCMPRVTFIGPKEEWRVQRKKFRNLYAIDVEEVYQWLDVLSTVNSLFIDEDIMINKSTQRQQQLSDMEDEIDANVHMSKSKVVTTVFDQASYDQTEDQDCTKKDCDVVIHNSAVLQQVERSRDLLNTMIFCFTGSPDCARIVDGMRQLIHAQTRVAASMISLITFALVQTRDKQSRGDIRPCRRRFSSER